MLTDIITYADPRDNTSDLTIPVTFAEFFSLTPCEISVEGSPGKLELCASDVESCERSTTGNTHTVMQRIMFEVWGDRMTADAFFDEYGSGTYPGEVFEDGPDLVISLDYYG